MKNIIAAWLSKREAVHVATTAEERQAIYRLRYDVFVGELNRTLSGIDHERRELTDAEDEHPGTLLLYTGKRDDITATIRIRFWEPGRVPAKEFDTYSMARFPGIGGLATADLGRLVVKPDARGMLILPALVRVSYEELAGRRGADLVFCCCSPGLVRAYRSLGMVPYGGRLIDTGSGPVQIPLVCVVSDAAALKRAKSLLAPMVKKYFGPGKRPPLDTTPFAHLLDPDNIPIQSDPNLIWEEISNSFNGEKSTSAFFGLSPKAMKRLSRSGFLIAFERGQLVFKEGTKEHEIYFVVEGSFEVFQKDRQIAVLTRGDLIGEIAFFTQAGEGKRMASVRAVTDGRLLVLRRKFLRELTHKDPEAGFRLLMNMSRIMAERLAKVPQD
ncbi:MAG: cyclic nucleotide-binding domain-containing protein [Rhodospirillaceae bacterium]|nr:cyclic nucleotide-binding domain-containing protein [Rhodospirillaceae bacterium]